MPKSEKSKKTAGPAHRLTRQLRVILEALSRVKTHPTADEVYQMAKREMPRISLGTVYRNLEVLTGQGKVLKLDLCGSQMRFDGCVEDHYHIRCSSCGRVDDLEMKPIARLKALQSAGGYKVQGHRLEFFGLCPRCKEKTNQGNSRD